MVLLIENKTLPNQNFEEVIMNKLNLFTSACLFGICNHVFSNVTDFKEKVYIKGQEAQHSIKAGGNMIQAGVEYLKVKFYQGEEKLVDAIHALRDKLHYMHEHLPTAAEIKNSLDTKYQNVKESLINAKNNAQDKTKQAAGYVKQQGHNAGEYAQDKAKNTKEYLNEKGTETAQYLHLLSENMLEEFEARKKEFEAAYESKKAGFAQKAHEYRVYLNSLWDQLQYEHDKFYLGEHTLTENIEAIRGKKYVRGQNSDVFNHVKECLDKKHTEIKAQIAERAANLKRERATVQANFDRQEKELLAELEKCQKEFESAYKVSHKDETFSDQARAYKKYLNALWENLKDRFNF